MQTFDDAGEGFTNDGHYAEDGYYQEEQNYDVADPQEDYYGYASWRSGYVIVLLCFVLC